MIPSPWEWALLALAAFRVWKLIADDAILDRPREALIQRLGDAGTGGKLELFITCPWCAGTYITLAWWGAWQLWPHTTMVAAGAVALLAAVGIIASALSAVQQD